MAKNYQQKGDIMPKVVAGAALASGQVVVTGSLVGVSLGAYEIGDTAQIALEGVFEVPKATGAIGHGAAVYWAAAGDPIGGTAGTGAATTTASGNTLMGYAFDAAASGDATATVRLLG
jgi:predicted RecA/RadA family phage recombinase